MEINSRTENQKFPLSIIYCELKLWWEALKDVIKSEFFFCRTKRLSERETEFLFYFSKVFFMAFKHCSDVTARKYSSFSFLLFSWSRSCNFFHHFRLLIWKPCAGRSITIFSHFLDVSSGSSLRSEPKEISFDQTRFASKIKRWANCGSIWCRTISNGVFGNGTPTISSVKPKRNLFLVPRATWSHAKGRMKPPAMAWPFNEQETGFEHRSGAVIPSRSDSKKNWSIVCRERAEQTRWTSRRSRPALNAELQEKKREKTDREEAAPCVFPLLEIRSKMNTFHLFVCRGSFKHSDQVVQQIWRHGVHFWTIHRNRQDSTRKSHQQIFPLSQTLIHRTFPNRIFF